MQTKEEILTWLRHFFTSHSKKKLPDDIENIQYYDAQLIDSLGIIILLEAVSEELHIEFTQDHFTDRRFSTIGGLADIITSMTNTPQ